MSKIKQLLESLSQEVKDLAPEVLATLNHLKDDVAAALKPVEESVDSKVDAAMSELANYLRDALGVDVHVVKANSMDEFADIANSFAKQACDVPPAGWECSRAPGHEGPCAASELAELAADHTDEEALLQLIDLQTRLLGETQDRVTSYHETLVAAQEALADFDVKLAKEMIDLALRTGK